MSWRETYNQSQYQARDEAHTILASGGVQAVLKALAVNPAVDPLEWLALFVSRPRNAQDSVAWNPSTPPEVLAALAEHGDALTHYFVAENPSTPPELLEALVEHTTNRHLLAAVAANPAAPVEIRMAAQIRATAPVG